MNPFGGTAQKGDSVEAQPLKFTTAAGIGAVVAAVAGTIPAVLEALKVLNLTSAQFIAVMALIAAGVIAFAIASAGDSLARAYASAWVIPNTGTKGATPVLAGLSKRLAGTGSSDGIPEAVIPAPGMTVKTVDNIEYSVLALDVVTDPEKIRYLVAIKGKGPTWLTGHDVRVEKVAAVA